VTPELISALVASLAALLTTLGAVLGKRAAAVREERDAALEALTEERQLRRDGDRRIGRLERVLDRAGIPDPDEQDTRRADDSRSPTRRRRHAAGDDDG
jgi:hypothetical protein